MRWEDERWIRVFTRDTGAWLLWPWESRALFLFILRKVDRAGILELGRGAVRALAAIVGMPEGEAATALDPLLDDGCVQIQEGRLLVANFMEAQEAHQSDRMRKQRSRESARDKLRLQLGREPTIREMTADPPPPPIMPALGTLGHDASHAVTIGHSETRQDETRRDDSDARAVAPEPAGRDETPEAQSAIATPDATKPESGYALAWRLWRPLWAAKYRSDYDLGPDLGPRSEGRVLQRIGNLAQARGSPAAAEAFLGHRMSEYLRDPGRQNYLADARHPLRLLETDWNKYGEPKAPRPKPVARREPAPAVQAVEPTEVASMLGGFLKNFGKGDRT